MISILEYFHPEGEGKFKKDRSCLCGPRSGATEQKRTSEKDCLRTTGYVQFEMHYDVGARPSSGGMVIRIETA